MASSPVIPVPRLRFRGASALGLAVLLASGPAAQQGVAPTFVVPAANTAAEATGSAFWALAPFATRCQLLIGSSQLSGLSNKLVNSITVRRNADSSDALPGRLHVEIWLSHSPHGPALMSTRFAGNRGGDHTKLFDGWVSLPAATAATTAPAPWTAPYGVRFALSAPFRYRPRGTLCVETVTTPSPVPTEEPWWPIDAVVDHSGDGQTTAYGDSCTGEGGYRPAGCDAGSLALGSTAAFYLNGGPGQRQVLFLAGASNTLLGQTPLPLDLTSLGAPGCLLMTSATISLPASMQPLPGGPGLAIVRFQIPLLMPLASRSIYTQWAVLRPGANPLGTTFSNGLEARLGRWSNPDCGWLETQDLDASAGVLIRGRMPVLRFDG